jgi:homoaconitase/3-isopropylmalate dehydratase large subunit
VAGVKRSGRRGKGRPGAINEVLPGKRRTVGQQIVSDVEMGASLAEAAAAVGVGYATVYEWLQRGRGEVRVTDDIQVYADFADAIAKAKVVAKLKAIRCLTVAAHKDPKYAVIYLERTDPKNWSAQARMTVSLMADEAVERVTKAFINEPDVLERALAAIAGHQGADSADETEGEAGP